MAVELPKLARIGTASLIMFIVHTFHPHGQAHLHRTKNPHSPYVAGSCPEPFMTAKGAGDLHLPRFIPIWAEPGPFHRWPLSTA